MQMVYGYGNYLYFGFANPGPATKMPVLAYITLPACGGLSDQIKAPSADGGSKPQAAWLEYLGKNGDASHPNLATDAIGIDSIVVYSASTTPEMYVANNGGVTKTANLPLSATSIWTPIAWSAGDYAGGVWPGTTQRIPTAGKLSPGVRGVPFMTPWDGKLYLARNRRDRHSSELWVYNGSAMTRIVDTFSSAGGMNTNNGDIGMVVVNGNRLYIAFDNAIDGAELWRTKAGVTAADFDSSTDLEKVGLSGFGPAEATDLKMNRNIVSHVSVHFDNKDYLYITVGCLPDLLGTYGEYRDNGVCDRDRRIGHTDFAIRMFRQIDE
jgi:hypothetical protein